MFFFNKAALFFVGMLCYYYWPLVRGSVGRTKLGLHMSHSVFHISYNHNIQRCLCHVNFTTISHLNNHRAWKVYMPFCLAYFFLALKSGTDKCQETRPLDVGMDAE